MAGGIPKPITAGVAALIRGRLICRPPYRTSWRMTAAQPRTKAQELVERIGARAVDLSVPVSELERRIWLRDLKAAIPGASNSEKGTLFNCIGLVYRRQGDQRAALEAFANARGYSPDQADIVNNEGASLLDLGRAREALPKFYEAARKPVKTSRTDATVAGNIAEALYALGQHDEARASLEAAVRATNPTDPISLFNLASSAAMIGSEDTAVETFARYLAVRRGVERGAASALAFIQESSDELKAGLTETRPSRWW